MGFFGEIKARTNFINALKKYSPDDQKVKDEYEKLVKEVGSDEADKIANPL